MHMTTQSSDLLQGFDDSFLLRPALSEWQQRQKAIFDRSVGMILLIVASPILLLAAFLVRIESPGPILFQQQRIGFNNKAFIIYKFRTMYYHNDKTSFDGSRQALRSDPRITRCGKWLRKFSIDELPQLYNVMQGNMSLVGPRPHPLNININGRPFREAVDNYDCRHRMLPGITGWAQVNGWRGPTPLIEQVEQRVAHDLFYIDNWSLGFDIRILFLTMIREIISERAF
jgi:lipopolysaccharide/colanic/teichoic acid biosynthesis glycosyltransferase